MLDTFVVTEMASLLAAELSSIDSSIVKYSSNDLESLLRCEEWAVIILTSEVNV